MVPPEPFHIAQIQITQPKAPVFPRLSQSNQPILYLFIFIRQQRRIPITTLADCECTARQSNTDTRYETENGRVFYRRTPLKMWGLTLHLIKSLYLSIETFLKIGIACRMPITDKKVYVGITGDYILLTG